MDADEHTANRILSTARCTLTLAVSRNPRGSVPEIGYVLTSDPNHPKGGYGSKPGYTVTTLSQTMLALVLVRLKELRIPNAGTSVVIREYAYNRPWFDISIDELPHELVMKVAAIHAIKA